MIRDTAKKLGAEIREGSLSPEGAKDVFRFVDAVRERIADLKPRDNLDAQGFLWTCHHLLKDGAAGGASREKRFWAGGIDWDGTPMQDEFIEQNEWRLGWNEESVKAKPRGRKFLDLFREVQIGDAFAMKGYGGRNSLKIHYVGEVIGKDEEDRTLALKPIERLPLYRGDAPKAGPGGSWFGSLTPVTNPEAIGYAKRLRQATPIVMTAEELATIKVAEEYPSTSSFRRRTALKKQAGDARTTTRRPQATESRSAPAPRPPADRARPERRAATS